MVKLAGTYKRHDVDNGRLFTDPDRFINSTDALGRIDNGYKPTFDFGSTYINPFHHSLSEVKCGCMGIAPNIDLGIEGYLERADALKLYELGYLSDGDVLELGTYQGLSTSILARAVFDSETGNKIITVDRNPVTTEIAIRNLANSSGSNLVKYVVTDATAYLDLLIQEKKKFGFIFIDHWHGYDATYEAATRLPELLNKGGFALFHDYNDPNNANPEHVHKVYQAVGDTLAKDNRFRFCTISGLTALFQYL